MMNNQRSKETYTGAMNLRLLRENSLGSNKLYDQVCHSHMQPGNKEMFFRGKTHSNKEEAHETSLPLNIDEHR